jgi:diguanylate cyclase (GGDEF)-like protein/PAS domain S-box-containing protein/putative nucleotidyltransferase with HDIG domain
MPVAFGLQRIILDGAGHPVDYEFVEVNDKFEEITGLSARDITGRRVTEVLPGIKDGEFDWIGVYGGVALSGTPLEFEKYNPEQGRWYSVNVYSPEKEYFVTLFTDITTQKNAFTEASQSEEKLRMYMDFAPLGIIVVSDKAKLLEANPEACRICGYPDDELFGLNLQRLIERNSRIMSLMFFKDLLVCGEAACQLQIKTKWGELRWLSINARTVSEGRHTLYCQDITSYKELEDDLVKSELLYRTFINASKDIIYLKDEDLRYVIVNKALLDQLGSESSEIIGRTDYDIRPNGIAAQVESEEREIVEQKADIISEMAADGKVYEAVKFPVSIGNGKTGVGAYIRDVTDEKKRQTRIENLLRQTQAMFNEHDAVMLLLKPESGEIIDANPAAVSFYGYTKDELLSMKGDDINMLPAEEAQELRREIVESKRKFYSYPHRLKNGEKRIVDVYSCPITYNNETVLFSIIFDVTEREEAFDEIKYLSFHDHLTGLFNRRYFDNVLKIMNDERFMPLTIVMADVNGLKLVNDSFGHTEGDELLKKAAEVITDGCRKDDLSCRIGGDEFVILLPNTDSNEAGKIVRRIKKMQSRVKIHQLDLSMSFGYAVKYDVAADIELIVSEAENKMYKNKMHESASTRNKTVSIIMKTLYEKCIGELEHSNRVSRIAGAIATELGLSPEQSNQISVAGLLHDIGKIGIDDSVLNKKGIFTKADREEIEKHSESGWRILSNSDEYSSLADYILYHHESPDGKGYPRGIKGESIPLESRIIAVSDAFDAMTNDRPYRKALTREQAIGELQRLSGAQFDPEIVAIFVERVLGGQHDYGI